MKITRKQLRRMLMEATGIGSVDTSSRYDTEYDTEAESDQPGTAPGESSIDAYPNPMADDSETTGADTESYEERVARLKRQAKQTGTEFDEDQDGALRAMKKMFKSNAGYRVRQFLDFGQSQDRIRYATKLALDEIFAEREE